MPLTDTAVKKAKPGPRPMKLSDGKGMYLLVNPTGSKLWRWKHRVLGKEKVMALGAYPDVSLAQARDSLAIARKLFATGVDPVTQRKADRQASLTAAENSFETVARKWWAHWKPARTEQHAGQVMRRFEANVFPYRAGRPGYKAKAEQLHRVDIRQCHRGAYLRPGRSFSWSWNRASLPDQSGCWCVTLTLWRCST